MRTATFIGPMLTLGIAAIKMRQSTPLSECMDGLRQKVKDHYEQEGATTQEQFRTAVHDSIGKMDDREEAINNAFSEIIQNDREWQAVVKDADEEYNRQLDRL